MLGAVLRLFWLDKYPVGFTGDEAQQGYSGYSILLTGKDEWGDFLPLFPRGFGDYKPPVFTYLTIPFIALLGLTETAVRLPAALSGILLILVVYFVTKELFDETTSLWAALLTSISPWAIQLSRSAFEGGIGVLTFSLGLLFLLKAGMSFKNRMLSLFFFGITLYTYHSWRIFTLLFLLTFFAVKVILIRKKQLVKLKFTYLNAILCLVVVFFLTPIILNIPLTLKRADVSIFSGKYMDGFFANRTPSDLPTPVVKALDNKYFYVVNQFFTNYLSYYSPTFLFTGSRSESTYLNFPETPLLYSVEIVSFLLGMFFLYKRKSPASGLLFILFLLAPVAAATTEGGNANRGLTFLPAVIIISAFGLERLTRIKKVGSIMVVAVLGYSLAVFLFNYFYKLPTRPQYNLRLGYREAFQAVLGLEDQFDTIIFSRAFTEPQIFIAFYKKIDPNEFQQQSRDWLRFEKEGKSYVDQLGHYSLNKFQIRDLNWASDKKIARALLIGEAHDFPASATSYLDIKNPKGEVVYRLIPTD